MKRTDLEPRSGGHVWNADEADGSGAPMKQTDLEGR